MNNINKITEGNAFALNIRQAVWRTLGGVIQPLLASELVDVHLYVGSGTSKSTATEYNVTADGDTISAVMPATLKRGVYRTWMTAIYQGRDVASACECAFEIVAFDEHGIYAPERIDGDTCVYLQGADMTDPEIEAYKEKLQALEAQKQQEVDALAAERERIADAASVLESGIATTEQSEAILHDVGLLVSDITERASKDDVRNVSILADVNKREIIQAILDKQVDVDLSPILNELNSQVYGLAAIMGEFKKIPSVAAIAECYAVAERKGATMPHNQSMENLPGTIDSIIGEKIKLISTFRAFSNIAPNADGVADLRAFDVSEHTSMNNALYSLKRDVDIRGWRTKQVTDWSSFLDQSNKQVIGFEELDFSNGVNFSNFCNGRAGFNFNIKSFKLPSTAENISSIFEWRILNDNSLDLDLSQWDTSGVKNFARAFINCRASKDFGFGSFDTRNGEDFNYMLYSCFGNNATQMADKDFVLDLSGYDMRKATNTAGMLGEMQKVRHLRVGQNWVVGVDISQTGLLHDALIEFFNDLPSISTSQTITIGSNKMALLSEEEIAIATAKGWTLA